MEGYKIAEEQMYANKKRKKRRAGFIEDHADNSFLGNYLEC